MLAEMTYIDWLGVLGSLIISAAYLAVSRNWVSGESPAFNLLNLVGAVLVLLSLYFRPNAGAIVIEVMWVLIALFALWRYWLGRR